MALMFIGNGIRNKIMNDDNNKIAFNKKPTACVFTHTYHDIFIIKSLCNPLMLIAFESLSIRYRSQLLHDQKVIAVKTANKIIKKLILNN